MLLAAHGIALGAVALAPTFPVATAVLAAAVLASAVLSLRGEAPLVLRLMPGGGLEVGDDGRRVDPAADSRLLPGFAVLAWKDGGRTVRRVVWPDSLPAEERRRLRVWLAWSA